MIFASEGVRWRWEKLRRAHEMRGAEGDLVLGELHTTDIILYPCKYICVILLEVITMKKYLLISHALPNMNAYTANSPTLLW